MKGIDAKVLQSWCGRASFWTVALICTFSPVQLRMLKHAKYEVLDPHIKLFKVSIGNNFLLMNDNALPHHAAQVTDYLEKEEFQWMHWNAYSPNLNPIEHVWEALLHRLAFRQPPPKTYQELRSKIHLEYTWKIVVNIAFHTYLVDFSCVSPKCCNSIISLSLLMCPVLPEGD